MTDRFMMVHLGFLSHPKAVRAIRKGGSNVVHMWLGLLTWMHEHDGEPLPFDLLSEVRGPNGKARQRAIDSLIDAGLLDRTEEGYELHDFEHWAADAEARLVRDYEKARKKEQRKKSKAVRDAKAITVPEVSGTLSETCPPIEEKSRRDENRGDEDETPADSSSPPALHDSERETTCPLGLADEFDGYQDMAERLGVSVEDLKAGATEFVTYWTIGAGIGKRRSHWARKLRQDLLEKHQRGRLGARSQRSVGGAGPSPEEVFGHGD